MSFTDAIKTCFSKYTDFGGRASLSEFWWFFLFVVILNLVASAIPVVGILVWLGTLLPSLAVGARRLHDTGRSGWLQLLLILPILGFIVLVVFWVQGSKQTDNAYAT